ncbi:MAG: DUF3794 domain-containing protein [Clostridia bacterium]|nr:DUF3794 domain-containing protein [Clostridia bacterium]
MDNLLKKETIGITHYALDGCEECAISCEHTLPDYCPDIAAVLKCQVTPRIQNRQWSGDRLMLDGMAAVRVLYLDEDRRCLRVAEFAHPFSCSLRTADRMEPMPASLELAVKYANCRAVTPRRLEVRGVVEVTARAECAVACELVTGCEDPALYTKCEMATYDCPVGSGEKLLSISESYDFPETLPPAEMLLGGTCQATVLECKVLDRKAIVKGQVYFHQLYTNDLDSGSTHCLDFAVPFSQILDVEGAEEGRPYTARVLLVSDTERCTVGPDGENSVLEVTAKLLVQFCAYETGQVPLLLDAYHGTCPITPDSREVVLSAHADCRWEQTVLPMLLELPTQPLQALVDVWVQPQGVDTICEKGMTTVSGRLLVCMLVRDTDGQIAYYERPEEYRLEYPCRGNRCQVLVTVTDWNYRVMGNELELKVSLCVELQGYQQMTRRVIDSIRLHRDTPYEPRRATALLYYAQPGEDVWEIGRRCRTSPESISRENELCDGCVKHRTVLMVPLIS